MRLVSPACLLTALVFAAPVSAQDPLKVAPTQYKLEAENERVRVLRATVAPGATTAMHVHPAHVGVALTAGSLRLALGDGKTQDIDVKADEVILVPAGAHTTTNRGKAPVEVIVIEMKGAPGTATIPAARPGMKMTRVLQDARVEAYRVSADASFHEAAGSTHPYDQVVVPLGAGDIALTMDGKTTSSWKRGDVRLIGRGVAHEAKAGKIPGDMIIVSIK